MGLYSSVCASPVLVLRLVGVSCWFRLSMIICPFVRVVCNVVMSLLKLDLTIVMLKTVAS